MNHVGAGIRKQAAMPPHRNTTPTMYANFALFFAAMMYEVSAPISVPIACARNGSAKCLGSNRWIDRAMLSASFMSTPAGGGMSLEQVATNAPFTKAPTITPEMTANTFRTVGDMDWRLTDRRRPASLWRSGLRRTCGPENLNHVPFPVDSGFIEQAESKLAVRFPDPHRRRLLRDNGGELVLTPDDVWQLFPVRDESTAERLRRTWDDVVPRTEAARAWPRFSSTAVAIGEDGGGDLLVLLPDGSAACAVAVWNHDTGRIDAMPHDIFDGNGVD